MAEVGAEEKDVQRVLRERPLFMTGVVRCILYRKVYVYFPRADWLVYMEPNSLDYGRI